MVTAGVYLLIRLSPLIEYSVTGLLIISWIGGLTALFAGTTAMFQNDLKRVIAYSTCSQLGWKKSAARNHRQGIFGGCPPRPSASGMNYTSQEKGVSSECVSYFSKT